MFEKKRIASWFKRTLIGILVILAGAFVLILAAGFFMYPSEYVFRVLAWGNSDAFDWQKFPEHRLEAAPVAFQFNEDPEERVGTLFARLAGTDNWDSFLAENDTQAFIVI